MVITAPIAPTGAPCAPLLESAQNAPLPATEIHTERTHGRPGRRVDAKKLEKSGSQTLAPCATIIMMHFDGVKLNSAVGVSGIHPVS